MITKSDFILRGSCFCVKYNSTPITWCCTRFNDLIHNILAWFASSAVTGWEPNLSPVGMMDFGMVAITWPHINSEHPIPNDTSQSCQFKPRRYQYQVVMLCDNYREYIL